MPIFTDPALSSIEAKIRQGISLDLDDGVALFRSMDIHSLGRLAKSAKESKSGKNVYYVLNRYINSTNVCYANCTFCSFARSEKDADKVRMSADEVVAKTLETGTNFNQLHIVGGHDPRQLSLDYWLPLMRRVKQLLPHVQLSLFTAAEIDYLARRHRLSYDEICAQLRAAGLDNVNGGGAEVFSERFRREVCPNKVDAAHWLEIHETLHRHGVASNATMLYGTIETIEERVEHLIMLRESQRRSAGFNAFIPLAFHPDGNALSHHGWTSGLDDIRMFAVARLMLDNFDHIKAYWMIQGLKVCQLALEFGADDMDGTHGSTDEERIYHSAGTSSGQYVDDREFRRLIEEAGYVPVRRNSTYETFPHEWAPPTAEPVALRRGSGQAGLTAEPPVLGHMTSHKLRYGRIAYVNVAPVETAFDVGAVARDVDVFGAVPTQLNAAMSEGRIDAGAISAAHYLAHTGDFVRIADLCIAADGPVRTVLFVSPTPPALLGDATIAVTSHSASGRALLAALLSGFRDVRPRYEVVEDALGAARSGRPTLVIGDDALIVRAELPRSQVHDLGEAWRAWTGLPFVFAVWAVRREALAAHPAEVAALTDALVAARDWGEANREAVIDAAVAARPYHRALYGDYFARLSYRLDERAAQGLERFSTLFMPEAARVAR